MGIIRTIPVRDANGDEFTLYEFEERRFLKKIQRLKLCTGEIVAFIDDTFVVIGTGERLVPIDI